MISRETRVGTRGSTPNFTSSRRPFAAASKHWVNRQLRLVQLLVVEAHLVVKVAVAVAVAFAERRRLFKRRHCCGRGVALWESALRGTAFGELTTRGASRPDSRHCCSNRSGASATVCFGAGAGFFSPASMRRSGSRARWVRRAW